MSDIMLETDIIVDFLRNTPQAIRWYQSLSDDTTTYISGYTYFEILTGCRSNEEVNRSRAVVSAMTLVWPSVDACNRALAVYARLRLSHGVQMPDTLTAYCAIEIGVSLYTFNMKHFRPFSDLVTVQPYER